MSQSLSHRVESITFVLPRIKSHHFAGKVKVVGANLYAPTAVSHQPGVTENPLIQFVEIDSPLTPYMNEKAYRDQVNFDVNDVRKSQPEQTESVLDFSGDYGLNLFDEVQRYGRVASAIANDGTFDIIHAHDWLTFPAAVAAKRACNIPLIVHVHATEFDRSGEAIDQRIYAIEKLGLEVADHIIAVSRRTKDLLINRYSIPEQKITVVYNGISEIERHPKASHHSLQPRPKTVSFLGRITMQKGPEYFIEAAYLVTRKIDDVEFVMAGTGDMVRKMIERVAELGLIERFHFTGFLDEKKRAELFARTDLFVMTSVSEPFGLTPIEALQYDIPCIVPKQSGVSEILHHVIKVDFWDVRKIADAMIKILTEKGLAEEMVAGSRRDLANVSWDIAADKINELYREIA